MITKLELDEKPTELTLEIVGVLLEQIEWQRFREGVYSGLDPLLATQKNLRLMRENLDSGNLLNQTDIRLLLNSIKQSRWNIQKYDYGDPGEGLRVQALRPLNIAEKWLRENLEWY